LRLVAYSFPYNIFLGTAGHDGVNSLFCKSA
jgi:hypothetical protein